MKKFTFLLFFSSLFFYIPLIFAANINKAQLLSIANKYLTDHQHDEHISAIQLTIKLKGKSPVSVSTGSKVIAKYEPVNNNSLFQIGSITKSFVTAIILQLEADPAYQFSIEDRLGKFFPKYPRWKEITIKQLMNMTSGIPSFSSTQLFLDTYQQDPFHDWAKKNH